MSLSVYLTVDHAVPQQGSGIFIRRDGRNVEISREEWDQLNPGSEPAVVTRPADETSNIVFEWNITHNLTGMANAAGLYSACWRPDELGAKKAGQLVKPLLVGLFNLTKNPDEFKALNPGNGWGTYEGLVEFVEAYLLACVSYPEADIEASR